MDRSLSLTGMTQEPPPVAADSGEARTWGSLIAFCIGISIAHVQRHFHDYSVCSISRLILVSHVSILLKWCVETIDSVAPLLFFHTSVGPLLFMYGENVLSKWIEKLLESGIAPNVIDAFC
jgi:hypothetical protein